MSDESDKVTDSQDELVEKHKSKNKSKKAKHSSEENESTPKKSKSPKKPKPPSEKPKPPSEKPKPPEEKPKPPAEKPKPPAEKPKPPEEKPAPPSKSSKSSGEKSKSKSKSKSDKLKSDDSKSDKKKKKKKPSKKDKSSDKKDEGIEDKPKNQPEAESNANVEEEVPKKISLTRSLTFKQNLYRNLEDFEKVGKIGKGSFGSVDKYKNKETGELFAFKFISLLDNDSEDAQRRFKELRREIVLTSLFKAPTLHSLYGIIDDTENNKFIIITPFYAKGDLQGMITKDASNKSPAEYDLTQKLIIMYGVASGMYILHSQDIIHRDLKPGNVLLTDDLEPLITDFGLSKMVDQENSMFQTQAAGSPIFTAPEVFDASNDENINYDGKKADVYSFSILCFQLFTHILMPYNIKNQFQLMSQVSQGKRPQFPGDFNPALKELICKCWKPIPNERLSFEEILLCMGKREFIESFFDADSKRFYDYLSKVAPDDKFINVEDYDEEEEEEEDIDDDDGNIEDSSEEIPLFDSQNFSINKSLLKKKSDYERGSRIGKGRSGIVFNYKDKKTGEIVAIKKVECDISNKNLQREVFILSNYHHPTLLKLNGFIDNSEDYEFFMITAFCKNGDLVKMIEKENLHKSPPEWNHTQKYIVLYGIAAGMYYLHKHDLIHRDLKPENVLLNDDLEPVISDFGLSKLVEQGNTMFQTAALGTPAFMAPEIIFSESLDEGVGFDGKCADVYAYGLISYQLLTGLVPFSNSKTIAQHYKVLKAQKRPTIPSDLDEHLKELITGCWQESPEERPTFEIIVNQLGKPEFIQELGNVDLEKFAEYQDKVVPRSLRFVSKFLNKDSKASKKHKAHKEERLPLTRRNTWRKSPAEIIKEMADAGDAASQYNYGCMLRDGKGIESNLEEAASYFKMSSEQDYAEAIIEYAKCLKEGLGVEKNEKEAYRLMESAANQDSSEAEYNLGLWYANDHPPQFNLAAIWLKKAADNDNPDADAPATYANLLERGKLGPIPPHKVITDYYQKSSEHGSPKGMYHMALLYYSGEDKSLPKNINEAIRLFDMSAQKGIQDAILSLSYACELVKKYDEAFNNARFYADQDNFYGYVRLSELHESGLGCEKDEEKSKEYLQKACDKRFSKVQAHISSLYSHGKGVPTDEKKAVFWAQKAAENGSAEGATTLGDYYSEGYGVGDKNIDKALEWAHKGAEGGDTAALRLLSKLYGSMKNKDKQIKYLIDAAKAGDERSMIKLGELYVKKHNYNDAVVWFKEAAENMNPMGCFYYGEELVTGNHVDKDVKEGLRLLELSASLNNEKAIELLHKIYSEGTPDVPKDSQKELEYSNKLLECKRSIKKKNRRKSAVGIPEIKL